MNDQARLLREQIERHRESVQGNKDQKDAKSLAIISGKGGVGKSNFSLNFSIALQQKGNKVLLFDLDIGMANIDILMGTTQGFSIVNLFEEGRTLDQIIQRGPENLSYIAGGSGLTEIFKMDEQKRRFFLSQLEEASANYDYIIFDMGAGITDETLQLLLSVEEIFLLTTCEPTSLTDAYSALKYISLHGDSIPFQLILNKVPDFQVAANTAERLQRVAKQFLKKDLPYLGAIPDDKNVLLAVMEQTPFLLRSPKCQASKAVSNIASLFLEEKKKTIASSAQKPSLVAKLLRLFA
ncbi:flagellar biosynthesis protein FlhG [Bacillus tianshenii]|uniref:Flagellar biosynthesis protein FlhG n=1 Tax=Sutcliffiella tianshenii TaxID=1463404 RepID=A0ABS2NWF8_9BACI|nr:MinD/ParA family protein [Bacillus tianshenii]MBM7619006.1 flagellar biosynthesis protein FlhG [Bacillus tianshenii]